jgi:hypothetical protein
MNKSIKKHLMALANFLENNNIDPKNKVATTGTDIVIATLVGEASIDGPEAMQAIFGVIKNRSNHKGITMKDVCVEPKQFSMWNGVSESAAINIINQYKNAPGGKWKIAENIVKSNKPDNTGGATSYYKKSINPPWAKSPCWIPMKSIGNHYFGIDTSSRWIKKEMLPANIQKIYRGVCIKGEDGRWKRTPLR